MSTAPLNIARRLASDERGAVLPLFALFLFVMLFMVGLGLDHSRATHAAQRMSAAIDAAALMAGRALLDGQLSDSEIEEKARLLLNENFKAGGANIGELGPVEIQINRNTGAVTINTNTVVPATLLAIVPNFTQFNIPGRASVIFDQRDIELGIQLDVTGSMQGQKLADLKLALNGVADTNTAPEDQGLFDILLPDQNGNNKVRIGLAPYSAGVNLGAARAAAATNNRNAGSGCVYDRQNGDASDSLPGPGKYFGGRADLPSAQPCPGARVTPLSKADDNANERTRLKGIVRGFNAAGTTAGQVGTNWAWNIISPEWRNVWGGEAPAAYGTANVTKAVILMTDGEYNTTDGRCDNNGCNPNGPRGRQSNDRAKRMCESMKEPGRDVIVYTVGFQLNNPVAIDTLNSCASSSRTAFLAEDGEQLRKAFRDIANQLNNLRLTQ
ncbi:MAG: hypothetical protein C0511_10710 [Hyphomicrobium sp.]|nr:hypothetical protein [Hyphomicrobium sp.]